MADHSTTTNEVSVNTNQESRPISSKESTLGISMIVKNEAEIILTCLKSVADYLDYWVIHDTGSTDGTQDIIRNFFAERNIPGELHETPWKNFGYNRTRALEHARGNTDYVLLLDADFVLHVRDPDFKKKLTSPGYLVRYEGGLDYRQILLIEIRHNWAYYGVTHEYIDTRPQLPVEITEMITIEHTGEGSNRGEKFERDVKLLLQGIKDEPDNARYYFYLAQSYKDWDRYDEAIKYYTKRTQFPNWDEEVFYSYYQIAMCKKRRGDDFYDYVGDYLKAFKARPHRIEPLYQILDSCANDKQLADIGYQLGMLNSTLDYPSFDLLFIEKPLYDWMYLDMLSTAAHTAGKYGEALSLAERLVREEKYPSWQKKRFEDNLKWLREKCLLNNDSDLKPKLFRFQRIKPDVKENRVAVIIANYNMVERTNSLINGLTRNTAWPTDFIVVDNGSDQAPPSPYTAVALAQNVQTTHAWLAGLRYADSLEEVEDFRYLAYVFVITSTELLPQPRDLVGELTQVLVDDSEVVGVHPSLTRDSTSHWKQLFYQLSNGLRQTNMIDNIFSCYRADWFNSIGRFDPRQTYAWGIDIETSYLARKAGKKLMVNDRVIVRKITNIGYTMDRMGMTAEERFNKATAQMTQVLTKKYGENFQEIFNQNCFQESIPGNLPPEHLLKAYYAMMLNFEKMEGGHQLLIEFIYRNHFHLYGAERVQVLEVGATREPYPHLNSTQKLLLTSQVYGYNFTSIDVDPLIVEKNSNKLRASDGTPAAGLKLVCQKAEDFLENYQDAVHYVYLDGFDCVGLRENQKNPEREKRYLELQQKELDNKNSAQMHLDCVKYLQKNLILGGVICIGEPEQKARTAKPYLLRNGFSVLRETDRGLLLQKTPSSLQYADSNNPFDKETNPKTKYIITVMGYKESNNPHTNWFPWKRLVDVFSSLDYLVEWLTIDDLKDRIGGPRRRVFICWNDPTSLELIREGLVRKDDIIFQKLTSLGKGMDDVNWGEQPREFFKNWNWPIYQTVEDLYEEGFNIYGFGCQTVTEPFPEKHRICEKLAKAGRLFWINWGTTVYNQKEIFQAKPVMDNFEYDLGFVGSRWGVSGRGNVDQWDQFMKPLVNKWENRTNLQGSGLGRIISNQETDQILKNSKLCPIIHAPSWIAEEGIQDRFYTVFTAGRFGVVDNPGVYQFFNSDEVVCETDPEKYVQKSIYYHDNVKEQEPFIEKVQMKIKTKYNWYIQWKAILSKVLDNHVDSTEDSYDFYTRVNNLLNYEEPFYSHELD